MANEMTLKEYVSNITNEISTEVSTKTKNGLVFPEGYNPQNAFTTALLQIKEVVNKDGALALSSCTQDSVKQAVWNMLDLGLDPNKGHCFWIVYGDKLKMTESYFGKVFRCKRADKNIDKIFSRCVYEKDDFKFDIVDGNMSNIRHSSDADNIDSAKIKGAYATIKYKDDTTVSLYMSMAQIRTSWNQSKTSQDVHKKFPDSMAERTVLTKLAKRTINTETNDLLLSDIEESIDNNADEYEATEMIDITPIESTPEPVKEIETVEVKPVVKEPKKAKTTTATMNLDEVPSLT